MGVRDAMSTAVSIRDFVRQSVLPSLRLDAKELKTDADLAAKVESLKGRRVCGAPETLTSEPPSLTAFIPVAAAPAMRVRWPTADCLPHSPAVVEAEESEERPQPTSSSEASKHPERVTKTPKGLPTKARQQHHDPLTEWRDESCIEEASLLESARRLNVEKERAISDYLRRMMILSRGYDGSVSPLSTAIHSRELFSDSLRNGTAIYQLLSTLLLAKRKSGAPPSSSQEISATAAISFPAPQSVAEVRANYADWKALVAAHRVDLAVPADLMAAVTTLEPEAVYLSQNPSILLDVLMHLISTHLPPPHLLCKEEYRGKYCHQPPVDWREQQPIVSPLRPSAYATYHQFLCRRLTSQHVLPDPQLHSLPSDDCLVPGPLAAAFLRSCPREPCEFFARQSPPDSLFLPSVLPFLMNGVSLIALARKQLHHGASLPLTLNPRTPQGCKSNLTKAISALLHLPASDETVSDAVNAFYDGNQLRIIEFLWSVTPRPPVAPPYPSETLGATSVERAAAQKKSLSPPSDRAAGGALPSKNGRPPRASPPLQQSHAGEVEKCEEEKEAPLDAYGFSEAESLHLQQWLRSILSASFAYRAEDRSFTIREGTEPFGDDLGLIFSDGVVLAHVIRVMERCRCDTLDAVKPSSKRAAKRFNINRCLQVLQSERGVAFGVPLMAAKLLDGDKVAVLSLLRTLRHTYKTVSTAKAG